MALIICRCGTRCRVLQGKRKELLVEIDAQESMVRVHHCRAFQMIWDTRPTEPPVNEPA